MRVGAARGGRLRTPSPRSRSRPPSRRCSSPSFDWDLLGEPEPGLGRPPPVPAAGPDARRLQLDQRDDLHPRQPRRLRRLGGRRRRRLELRRRAAVLPPLRGQRARRGSRSTASAGRCRCRTSRSMHPLVDAMLEAARAAGHEHNPDFNGARQEGVGRFQLTQRDGLRCEHGRRVPAPGRAPRPNLDGDPAARWRCGSCSREAARSASRSRATARSSAPRRARGDPLGRRPTSRRCC